jgi:hypothetical protein
MFKCKKCGKIAFRNKEERLTNIDDENLCDDCFDHKFHKVLKNKPPQNK